MVTLQDVIEMFAHEDPSQLKIYIFNEATGREEIACYHYDKEKKHIIFEAISS